MFGVRPEAISSALPESLASFSPDSLAVADRRCCRHHARNDFTSMPLVTADSLILETLPEEIRYIGILLPKDVVLG